MTYDRPLTWTQAYLADLRAALARMEALARKRT